MIHKNRNNNIQLNSDLKMTDNKEGISENAQTISEINMVQCRIQRAVDTLKDFDEYYENIRIFLHKLPDMPSRDKAATDYFTQVKEAVTETKCLLDRMDSMEKEQNRLESKLFAFTVNKPEIKKK